MTGIYDLVPNNKYDISSIERLRQLTNDEITPILPELLKWLQDYNWPIAKEILPILAFHQAPLIPCILELLEPGQIDEIWKYNIIAYLIPLFSDDNITSVLPSIKRIAKRPTEDETNEEVEQKAAEFLLHFQDIDRDN